MQRRHHYLRFAIGLIFLAALGCQEKPSATQTSAEPPATQPAPTTVKKPPDLLLSKPDFSMKAEELTAAFNADNAAFLRKYGGKVLDITGPVENYDYSHQGDSGYLILGPGINKFECADPHPMAKAMPGQTVRMRGLCAEYGVLKWTIVEVKGDRPPEIAAEQLANDFKADEDGTAKKLRGRYLIVTGTIRNVERKVGVKIMLTPPGEKPEVTCFFGTLNGDVADRHGWLKEGQSVRVLGHWGSGDPNLNQCAVLPPVK